MASIKTAISLDRRLFEQMERIAKRWRVPRSRLFAEAVKEFLRKHEGEDLTQRINRAYETGETKNEKRTRRAAVNTLRQLLEGTW